MPAAIEHTSNSPAQVGGRHQDSDLAIVLWLNTQHQSNGHHKHKLHQANAEISGQLQHTAEAVGQIPLLWIGDVALDRRAQITTNELLQCLSGARQLLDQLTELGTEGGHQRHHHHDHQQQHQQQREQQ